MKNFKEYLTEAPRINKIFHSSPTPISSVGKDPMWFTIRIKDGMGYYEALKKESGDAYLYETRFTGDSIASLLNKKEMKKLSQEMEMEFDEKVSPNYWGDYVDKLVENPTGRDVSYMDQTEALSELGYQAVLYWDYDPRDSNKDLEAFLILNPPNRTSGLKQVKIKK
jgi:hypothetical protein